MGAPGKHTAPQFSVDPDLVSGGRLVLAGDALRRARALRLSEGDAIRVAMSGQVYEALIEKRSRDHVEALLLGPVAVEVPSRKLHLYAALLKGDKFDLVVEKCSELGVASITPVVTRRTIPRVGEVKASDRRLRWQRIARAASDQCGRPEPPVVGELVEFTVLVDRGLRGLPLVAAEWGKDALPLRRALAGAAEASILVGPEGGLDAEEISYALSRGITPVTLGPFILRAETASIAAAAVAMSVFLDDSR